MKISHVAWNLVGLSLPLAVAALTVPSLVGQLGQERFGVLTLAWGLIGYAGALDLGIGRALTQNVGSLIGKNETGSIAAVVATASRITFISGLIGCFVIVILALSGAAKWIKNTSLDQNEIRTCLLLLAVALPAQAMSATYKGLNEAYLNFKSINILRVVLGAFNFGGPFLISLYTNYLPPVIGVLVVSRLLALIVYRNLALGCLDKKQIQFFKYSRQISKTLFSFGGWLTVSSVISPILTQADRFVIASTISAAAVFVYVLPYEMVVQSLVVVGAITTVVFPGLTRMIYERPNEWRNYFKKWLLRVAFYMGVICISIAALLPWILPMWMKENLNPESIMVGQILCIGVFANSLAAMFYALLHAQGKAKATAKLHLLELPLFLIVLVFLTYQFGVKGAAIAWTARMIFDSSALAYMTRKQNA